MSLGRRIKEIRKDTGLNQTNFAESLKSTLGAFAKYEIDKVIPNDVFINLLCTKYKVNEEWLLTGEGSKYLEQSKDEEFADLVAEIMINENEDVKEIMMQVAQLEETELKLFLELLKTMNGKKASQ
ncbi:helix-turn-helix domain-containing protein [Bacillus albus]|uniref:helix-turn-helix domain-containing protein n=1 Tax=Bacillus albus TaxID=2026189 RepID=UPI00102200CC|nr:helix-turn-helix transcriptional regulator [Bacillus albus]